MTVASLDKLRRARRWTTEQGESQLAGWSKTHETNVAQLRDVIDAGGRLSAGLDDVEWEDAEVPLSRLADVFKWWEEEG